MHVPQLQGLPRVRCRTEHDGSLLRVELAAPPGNILDIEMMTSLRRIAAASAAMPGLRLLVFTGEGEHFSYGASVEEHRPDQVGGMLEVFHGLFRDLMAADVPLAALVRGQCLGGGLELAAFCDRVFVEENARLGQPEIRLGVFAPVGSLLLPWRCGARSAELLLTGRSIDGRTAASWGVADACVAAGAGEAAVESWFRDSLASLSPSSLRLARRASRWRLHRLLAEGMDELERLYLDELMQTSDAVEGINAFLEKRDPIWRDG